MSEAEFTKLTAAQKLWALGALVPFMLSIAFLGFALGEGQLLMLAIGWPALQILGYVGSIQRAKGDFAHPLFASQVMIHWIALALIIGLVVRAA
jgi:hypothetical protein